MKILAVDTSTGAESLALLEDGRLLGEWMSLKAGLHSRYLVRNIGRFVESMGVELARIGLFAITTGPGSFTGLRVGISTVKGLAWVLGAKTAGVSTLEALAMNVPPIADGTLICPVVDARQRELYTALFRQRGEGLERIVEDRNIKIDAIGEFISNNMGTGGGLWVLGDGLAIAGEIIEGIDGVRCLPERFWQVRAHNVGLLAWQRGLAIEPVELLPAYVRKSHAELKKEQASR